ncbi:hypothetical protein [Actinomadura sp. SCN-SB]|uniref:hypothetical protein n=1 Tax=Actinomadura sp. SCN-SB TaxID=3373092 RepID=UPI00375034D5
MDAEFIQSVARVGDYVELSLMNGATFEGVLEELTLVRLKLRRPDQQPVVIALASVVMVTPKTPPVAEPAAASPVTPAAPVAPPAPVAPAPAPAAPTPPAPAPSAAPEPPAPQPAPAAPAEEPSAPPPAAEEPPAPVPPARPAPEGKPAGETPDLRDALAEVAALDTVPVDFDVYVRPDARPALQQIRNSYEYAERINELDLKFNRVGHFYTRALHLWNGDQTNAELTRLLGALALLKGDEETAQRRLAFAADAGDVPAHRLLAIAAARLGDGETAKYSLLQYFHAVAPDYDVPAWDALLDLLDAQGNRDQLGELLGSSAYDEAAEEVVRRALSGKQPVTTPMPKPAGAVPKAAVLKTPPPPARDPAQSAHTGNSRQGTRRLSEHARRREDPYQRAKFLEHQVKDLDAAKKAYREAIRKGGPKRESAVKDLAWLTKRTEGAEAALRIIEEECEGMVRPGDSLDNILIDFLTGARRYTEALKVLDRQFRRSDLTSSKRYHLRHQIAYVKLAAGVDSSTEWRQLLDQAPDNPAAQRGLALALIQRGNPADLAEAEQAIEGLTDDRAANIRMQIEALLQGEDPGSGTTSLVQHLLQSEMPGLGDPTPPLVAYVVGKFSDEARTGKGGKPFSQRDLNVIAESARQFALTHPENSARFYITAASIAKDLGDRRAQEFLYLGLTTLADIVLDRQEHESARDLYCAALAAADEREDSDGVPDVRWALIGYLRSLRGRTTKQNRRRDRESTAPLTEAVGKILSDERRHGRDSFLLMPQLIADTSLARDLVLTAVTSRPELMEASVGFLRDEYGIEVEPVGQQVRQGWQQAGEQWSRSRRRIVHGLAELRNLTISEVDLEAALNRLGDHEQPASEPLRVALSQIREALLELRRYGNEQSFEERENCLRRAGQTARGLRAEVERGPTSLTVELVEPIAERVEHLVKDTQQQLVESQPPLPGLTLALEQSSGPQKGIVTVQIKVANAFGHAPLESPELTINSDPLLFKVDQPRIQLPAAVRGGDHRIEQVRLRVTEQGVEAGAFSLPVELRYQPRSSDTTVVFEATLPVRLARQEEFQAIPNPFQDGASGRPVIDENMFFGRDELISRIRAKLRDAHSPGIGIAVFGQKRAGKTSIRHHLKGQLEQDDGLPVVDVGNIGDLPVGNITDIEELPAETRQTMNSRLLALLMWRILEQADTALRKLDPGGGVEPLLPPDLDRARFLESPEPVYDCAMLIERYRERTGGRQPPLVVLIDEFQYIDQWIREGRLSPSFMQAFKALIERRLFHLVIVGQDALDRLIQADPNVFGVFAIERVTYLADSDARRLIVEPIWIGGAEKQISRYQERAVDRILELTGGSAFYIQRFCYQLVNYMNAEHAPVVTEADIERVRDEFISGLGANDFDNLESPGYTDPEFTPQDYQQVLLAIARASRHQAATIAAIRAEYQGPRLDEILADLVLRDVIRRDAGSYRIVVRIYQDWLLQHFGEKSGGRG